MGEILLTRCCCGKCHTIKVNANYYNGTMFAKGFVKCGTCAVYFSPLHCVIVGARKMKRCPCCGGQVKQKPTRKTRTAQNRAIVEAKQIE